MYLILSVGGRLTIFSTPTRRTFWPNRPGRILRIAVLDTQAIAACIAIFGLGGAARLLLGTARLGLCPRLGSPK